LGIQKEIFTQGGNPQRKWVNHAIHNGTLELFIKKARPNMKKSQNKNYKWYIMILGAVTNAVVIAIPTIALSVLLPEISTELHLNLVQAGLVWGMASFPMVIISLLAGRLSDRFSPKRILIVNCLLVGLTGAARGWVPNYALLLAAVFLCGVFSPLITVANFKNVVIWFPANRQSFANGIMNLGMASGFFVGSFVSATFLSPALGGWRNVFLFYGVISILLAIPWLISRPAPETTQTLTDSPKLVSFKESIGHLLKSRTIWLLALANMALNGGEQGIIGYMPLHLQDIGWKVVNAGGVLAAYNVASMMVVLPFTFLSDRSMRVKRWILIGATLWSAAGIGILTFTNGAGVWIGMIMAGSVRDGFIAVILAYVVTEISHIGIAYAGIATGFVFSLMGLGNLVSPPLGNSLVAGNGAAAPIVFWTALVILSAFCLLIAFSKKTAPARGEIPSPEGL
jgi:predicted MFS family arabinose efflux permease